MASSVLPMPARPQMAWTIMCFASSALLLRLYGGAALNLTAVDAHAFRTHPVASTAGCRWLDDGQDQEIAYFDVKSGSVARLRYMNGAYERDP